MSTRLAVPSTEAFVEEFEAAALPDRRLVHRLKKVAAGMVEAPDDSFPALASSDAELEAIYRFLSNERVTWRALLKPHLMATRERIRMSGSALIVHDTTDFYFGGTSVREDLGHMPRGQGFYGHFALAVSEGKEHAPLGVLGIEAVFRAKPVEGQTETEKTRQTRAKPWSKRESSRWGRLAVACTRRLLGVGRPIHVMDREADDYALLDLLVRRRERFVIRSTTDRLLVSADSRARLRSALQDAPSLLLREVPLTKRRYKNRAHSRAHPPRNERQATLHVRWASVEIRRPDVSTGKGKSVRLNAVEVFEPAPPEGEAPITWTLLTSEPVSKLSEAEAIVDHYRARWRVEEYFKALKTGCAYEKRQLESAHALLNALALLAPVAWRLLLIRTLSRTEVERPAGTVLRSDEIELLRKLSKRVALGPNPTVQDALLALAGLGGHIKNNGPPGWQVLGRGYEKFSTAYLGWRLRGEK